MYNVYNNAKAKKSNKASMTLSDYADINNLTTMSLKNYFDCDKSINPAFNRGGKNYYHIEDLDKWVRNNKEKVKSMAVLPSNRVIKTVMFKIKRCIMRKFNIDNESLIGSRVFYVVIEEIKRIDRNFTKVYLSELLGIELDATSAVVDILVHSGAVIDLSGGLFKTSNRV